ncbi:S1 family peptidase [Rhodopseudomonas sp. NSM]|uniref:S1 family peptidase n=1 Tax=Rhodopseudomonas sp. NSM TaxID=3457630 RepID=UPI0040350350
MIRSLKLALLFTAALAATPCVAMVGGARERSDGLGRAIVTIVGSRGNFCSGALIAPDLVLSAAHCVAPGADYKIVQRDAQGQPQLRDIRRLAAHPQFDLRAIKANRATADIALLQLAAPLPGRSPVAIAAPGDPLSAGQSFTVAGIGVAQRGDGKSGGVVRAAELIATGRPGRLQIRLVDPATNNAREGQGACTGDSGGPALQQQNGRAVVIGVVSWSTGAANASGCGGLTGITPLTLYRDWIETTARSWGATLAK